MWLGKASEGARHPSALVVSQDIPGRSGSATIKRFRIAADFEEYSSLLLGGKNMYEVIPCGATTPVWFFADHDCRDAGEMSADEFASRVSALHVDFFGLSPADIGRTVFVSSSSRKDKLSVHVKVNVRTTLAESKHIAALLRAHSHDHRLHPDPCVYSSALQQIRAVGSAKLGSAHAKTPVHHGDFAHHLVRIPPSDTSPVVPGPATIGLAPAPSRPPPSRDSLALAEHVRNVLRRAPPRTLGPLFDPATCVIESPRPTPDGVSCYVDGSLRNGGTLVCPIAGRAHRSNRAVVETPAGAGVVFYSCLSPGCRSGRKIAVAVVR